MCIGHLHVITLLFFNHILSCVCSNQQERERAHPCSVWTETYWLISLDTYIDNKPPEALHIAVKCKRPFITSWTQPDCCNINKTSAIRTMTHTSTQRLNTYTSRTELIEAVILIFCQVFLNINKHQNWTEETKTLWNEERRVNGKKEEMNNEEEHSAFIIHW